MSENDKPGLLLRVKATTNDSIILIVLMGITADIFARIGGVPVYSRVIAFLVIFVLYEPIMVSQIGSTFGHHMNKLKVQRDDNGKRLSFGTAFIRFIIKATLGIISLFTVTVSKDKKAIHDMIVNSTVEFDE